MCLSPINIRTKKTKFSNGTERKRPIPMKTQVPCGKCARCEMKKRKDWAFRMHEETKDHLYGHFCMLTYDETTVPWLNLTTGEIFRKKDQPTQLQETDRVTRVVQKTDIQLFIKNLRRQQQYYSEKLNFDNTLIRYFIVSEYGTKKTKRPHYHAVIWGMHPIIADMLTSQRKIWKHGIATARPLEEGLTAFFYLTKYIYKQKLLKKWTIPPFTLMSTQPFIGHSWLNTGFKYLLNHSTTFLENANGHNQQIPRIYLDKLPHIKKYIGNQKIITNFNKNLEKRIRENPKENHDIGLLDIMQKVRINAKHEQEINNLNQII